MHHKKRKLIVITLVLSMILGLCSVSAYAWPFPEGNGVNASDCTNNKTVQSIINYIKYEYPNISDYPGGGTCFGYALTINDLFASDVKHEEFYALKFTKKNFLEKALGVRAGTHIRFSDEKMYSGGFGHSVVLLKVTEDMVYFCDNNYYTWNTVAYSHMTVDQFCEYYDYKYINMIEKPVKYKTYKKTKVAARAFSSGHIRLRWIKTTHTSKYEVYRKYSKNGSFKKIATVKGTTYLDKNVKRNHKVYYKIKSIRSTGNTTSSVIVKKSK